MPLYTEEVALASEMIDEFGGDHIIRGDDIGDRTVRAVVLPEGGKMLAYVAALGLDFRPATGMMVFKGSEIIGAIADGVEEINPNSEEPILYVCPVTKWPITTP